MPILLYHSSRERVCWLIAGLLLLLASMTIPAFIDTAASSGFYVFLPSFDNPHIMLQYINPTWGRQTALILRLDDNAEVKSTFASAGADRVLHSNPPAWFVPLSENDNANLRPGNSGNSFRNPPICWDVGTGWPLICLRARTAGILVGSYLPGWQQPLKISGGFRIGTDQYGYPMLLPVNPYWPYLLIDLVAMLVLAEVPVHGTATLIRLRRRKHGRCMECGYDLSHTAVQTGDGLQRCPECGRVARPRATQPDSQSVQT